MSLFLDGIIVAMLILLAAQDWKDRAVNWYWFPLLLIAAVCRLYLIDAVAEELLVQFGLSLAFVLLNMAVLFVYLYLRYGKTVILSGNLVGSGDLLFFLVLIYFGSFLHYLLFFTVSMAVSLLFWLMVKKHAKYETVPLAGLQAICLALVWIWVAFTGYDTYNDDSILALLFA